MRSRSSFRARRVPATAVTCFAAALAAVALVGSAAKGAEAARPRSAAQTAAQAVRLPGKPSVWPIPSHFSRLTVVQLSGAHSLVAGSRALVGIGLPAGIPRSAVRVSVNGRNETPAFAGSDKYLDPDFTGLVGLVTGLRDGEGGVRNVIQAWAGPGSHSRATQLSLFAYPSGGPIFSGPQLQPWFCTTQDLGLGPAKDANCDAPTQVQYWYEPAGGSSLVRLTSLKSMPADVADIKTSQGRVVPYIVRLETGTLDRGVYYIGILDNPFAPGGNPQDSGWNRKLVYAYAGGCEGGNNQGSITPGGTNGGSSYTPLDPSLQQMALAKGYAVATSTLNWYATSCNEVLSAEATLMVEQHFAQTYGVPDWTVGWGGSGGSIQQMQIAEDYPGLLNGIIPQQTFPDAPTAVDEFGDCGLLYHYFTTSPAVSWTPAQEAAASGYLNFQSCASLWKVEGSFMFAPGTCAAAVPSQDVYNAATNPAGVRCDFFDQDVNLYGRNPATGSANRFFGNTGVQYGLDALLKGQITGAQFINLNARIGSIGANGNFTPGRTAPDPAAVRAAYGDGRMDEGQGGLTDLPILDVRAWVDNSSEGKGFYDPHVTIWSMITRAKLDEGAPGGTADNYVNWVVSPAASVQAATQVLALATMDQWLDAIAADPSSRPLPAKIAADKPGAASDACFTADGTRHKGSVTVGGTNFCSKTFPPYSQPRLVAGAPLSGNILDCRLTPVNVAAYHGRLTAQQMTELRAIFPDGVCDYSSQSQDLTPFQGTWLAF